MFRLLEFHDAVYPLGFCISDCDSKITYAAIWVIAPKILENHKVRLVLIESITTWIY